MLYDVRGVAVLLSTVVLLSIVWKSMLFAGSVVHFSGHQATEAAIKLTSLGTFAGEQGTSSVKRFKYGCTNEQVRPTIQIVHIGMPVLVRFNRSGLAHVL